MDEEVLKIYGNRVRIRVCGLCWQDDQLLLVNHAGVRDGDFWAPPGGGVEFGTTIDQNLQREIHEETGLEVATGSFLFGCEFVRPPLHSLELFFDIRVKGGKLDNGNDPELQIIKTVKFLSPAEISGIPESARHGIFKRAINEAEFRKLSGFYRV